MKLERQYASRILSARLRDLGLKNDLTIGCFYSYEKNGIEIIQGILKGKPKINSLKHYSAAELVEICQNTFAVYFSERHNNKWIRWSENKSIEYDSFADAMAGKLIYVLENDYLDLKFVNDFYF
jgi:hypothetical protein